LVFRVLIAALIGIILMLSAREPRYRGRSLTSWLQQCYETPLNESQRLAEAQQAVCAMPLDKVLPRLLRLVEARDDPVSPWIMAKSDEFRLRFLKWRSAEDFQQLGIAGFEALETNAAPAIGELTTLLADNQHAFTAVRCLVAIGTPAEVAVSRALTNKSEEVRSFATQQFGWVTDDTEDFLAHMKKCLNDPDGSVRFAAVQGIGLQTQAPDSAIPLLLEALRDEQDTVSSWAAKFLADFGTNAVRTFPDLSNVVANGSSKVTVIQALRTMVALAPQEALPIVFNNFRSSDPRRRSASVELLSKYPATNLEIQAAIQQAAADPDPVLARRAKELITKKYQAEHPLESQFSDEPSYGGKRLDEWLKAHDREGNYSEDAKNAIQRMGTNAIPALLGRLVYVQPPFGLRAFEVNMDAVRAFISMGEQIKPAFPILQELMDSTNQDIALLAMVSTCGTGSNAMPFLIKGLTNQFADVRSEAAHFLTDSLGAQFPEQLKPAIPLIVKLLDDPDESVRMNATNELKEIDPEAAAKAGIK
jgi:HEAT repeat protein